MISPSCDMEEFVRAVEGKGRLDIIFSAVQEATEAERISCQDRRYPESHREGSREYANTLKELVYLLRSSSLPRSSSFGELDLSRLIHHEPTRRAEFYRPYH
jgi:hypothetical protein